MAEITILYSLVSSLIFTKAILLYVNIFVNSSLLASGINYMPSSALPEMNGNILLIFSVRTELCMSVTFCYVLLEQNGFAKRHNINFKSS